MPDPSIKLDREKGRAWTAAEDQQLLNAVTLIQTDECLGVSWNAVAHHVPGRTPSQCAHRFKKSADPTIHKGAWSEQEDQALLKAVHNIGEEWAKIRDSNVVPGRTDMQLRDRYYNALSMSHSKGPWTRTEDELLRQGYNMYGQQWTLVSEHVQTRTDGQCLKRYSLLAEYKTQKKQVKYVNMTNTKLKRNLELRRAIKNEMEQQHMNERMLEDDDLAVIGRPRDALDTIRKHQPLISNLGESVFVESCAGEDEKLKPKQDSLVKLLKQCKKMYKPARAVQYSKFFMEKKTVLADKVRKNATLYRKHLRKALEPNEQKLKTGQNVYLPPSAATVKLVSELARGRHERKKLDELASKIRGSRKVASSGELNALLQSLMLMTMTQLKTYPGAKFTKTRRQQVK